jgi:hypothetical protein
MYFKEPAALQSHYLIGISVERAIVVSLHHNLAIQQDKQVAELASNVLQIPNVQVNHRVLIVQLV